MSKRTTYTILQDVRGDYRGRGGDLLGYELEAGEHVAADPVCAELLEHLVTIGLAERPAPVKRPARGV